MEGDAIIIVDIALTVDTSADFNEDYVQTLSTSAGFNKDYTHTVISMPLFIVIVHLNNFFYPILPSSYSVLESDSFRLIVYFFIFSSSHPSYFFLFYFMFHLVVFFQFISFLINPNSVVCFIPLQYSDPTCLSDCRYRYSALYDGP